MYYKFNSQPKIVSAAKTRSSRPTQVSWTRRTRIPAILLSKRGQTQTPLTSLALHTIIDQVTRTVVWSISKCAVSTIPIQEVDFATPSGYVRVLAFMAALVLTEVRLSTVIADRNNIRNKLYNQNPSIQWISFNVLFRASKHANYWKSLWKAGFCEGSVWDGSCLNMFELNWHAGTWPGRISYWHVFEIWVSAISLGFH